jgi:hypothetical protein
VEWTIKISFRTLFISLVSSLVRSGSGDKTVAQGEISRVEDRGLDNPELFQNLVHFYGKFFSQLDQAL